MTELPAYRYLVHLPPTWELKRVSFSSLDPHLESLALEKKKILKVIRRFPVSSKVCKLYVCVCVCVFRKSGCWVGEGLKASVCILAVNTYFSKSQGASHPSVFRIILYK